MIKKTSEQERSLEKSKKLNEDLEKQVEFLEKSFKNTENDLFSVKKNKNNFSKFTKTRTKSEEKIAKLFAENLSLNQTVESLEQENKIFEKKIQELENSLEKQRNQVSLLKFETKRIKDDFSSRENLLIQQYSAEIKDKENLINRLSDEKDREFSQSRQKNQKLMVLNDLQSLISSHRSRLKK